MNKPALDSKRFDLLFVLVLLAFVISKCTHLNIPYFWDESWVYAPAVNIMAENGPSILTNAIPLEYSRGHPLLFQFLGGVWIKIFGNSLISLHSYALTISTLFLISFYLIARNWFSRCIALVAISFLIFQPMFYAQASLVLPEIFLASLCLIALHFSLKKKWVLYLIFGSLAIWTKESAVAYIASIAAALFIHDWFKSKLSIKTIYLSMTPLLSFVLFMMLQKQNFGWYLYPEHTGLMELDLPSVFGKLKAIANDLFRKQKKLPLSLIGIFSMIFILIRHRNKVDFGLLFMLVVPIVGYSIFCSLNFYTVRYILVVLPLLLLLLAYFIVESFKQNEWILAVITFAIMVHSIIQLFDKRSVRDINLSYLDFGPAQLEVVEYMERNELYDESIFTGFLTSTALSEMHAGYRNSIERFSSINQELKGGVKYFIFSSLEPHWLEEKVKSNKTSKLLNEIRKGNVKFEIYRTEGNFE